jgi:hypothetical protein
VGGGQRLIVFNFSLLASVTDTSFLYISFSSKINNKSAMKNSKEISLE